MTKEKLSVHLNQYLALKTALGYKLRGARRTLFDFLDYVELHNPAGPIAAQLVLDWACSSACRPAGHTQRLSLARGFLFYLRALIPETEVPDIRLIPAPLRPMPYIYSQQEISQLMQSAEILGTHNSLLSHTFSTLIGLLASSGLRIGEAIRLADTDARLEGNPAVISINESKFRKSRVVPVHPTVAEKLQAYRRRRGRSRSFFVDEHRRPLRSSAVWRMFDRIRKNAGITTTTDGRRPTTHALRHTFAVTRLIAWYNQGLDVSRWLPHLSVYMGHVEPKCTYWYLSATPELLRHASNIFERYATPGGAQ